MYSTGMLEVIFILTCVPVVTNIASLQFHDRSAQVAPIYLHVDVVTRNSRRCKIYGHGFYFRTIVIVAIAESMSVVSGNPELLVSAYREMDFDLAKSVRRCEVSILFSDWRLCHEACSKSV